MKKWKGLLSLLLALSLLVPSIAQVIPTAAAAGGDVTAVGSADPSTVIGALDSNALAGSFYADKSVSYDAVTQSFTATLSALTKDYQENVSAEDLVPMDVIVIVDTSGSMKETVVTPDTTDWTRVDYLAWGMTYLINNVIVGTNNRLGVVTFSGNIEVGTSDNNAQILLPLDRYSKVDFSTAKTTLTLSDGKTTYETKKLDVTYQAADATAESTASVNMAGGTFTQTGIAKAYDMMSGNTDRTVTVKGQTVYRTPVVVLITDGQPTWANSRYSSITSSTQSGIGDGSSDTDQSLDDIAYYTIRTAKYYSDRMAKLYSGDSTANPNYRFMTVGIGVDVLSNVSATFASAFLNPTKENVAALNSDSDYYVNNSVQDSSGNTKNYSSLLYSDLGGSSYTGTYDYATDSYVVDNANTGYAMAQVFADIAAISVSTAQTDYYGPLESGTMVTFTDTVGDGMYISSAPVLNYAGTDYYATRTTSGNTVTYTYSGTVKPLNASDYADYTVSLDTMRVTVTTDINGRQTLTWNLPAELVPSYSYDTANKSYVAAEAVKLSYDIEPTSETLSAVTSSGTTLYTNNYTDAPTTVSYSLSTESAYYTATFGEATTAATAKSSNVTGTNANVMTVTAGATHDVDVTDGDGNVTTITCAAMTATLGNNGKLVLTREADTDGSQNGYADPSTVITGITQSAMPGTVSVDKSISYDSASEEFNATLSAIAKDYYETLDESLNIPMDVVFVLDISNSMNTLLGSSTTSRRMAQVTTQINTLCSSLISANSENRIGIVTYSGAATTAGVTESNASTLLSLGAYSSVSLSYSYDTTNSKGTLTALRNGSSYTGNSVTVTGGTYTQTGIAAAYKMLSDETTRTYTTGGKTYDRTPVIILVTDGQPTWATTDYSNSVIGTSTIGDGTIGIDDSTQSDVRDVSMDEIAYYTILSGQYFAGETKALYNGNPNSRFYTVGVGMNDMAADTDAVDSKFVTTVLDPSAENVSNLTSSSTLLNYASDLHTLLTASDTLYNGSSYADQYFNVSDADISGLSSALLSALQQSETRTIHHSAILDGTELVFTDTIGDGMEITSAPVLTYDGKEYLPTVSGGTYTYSGTVYPDASLTPVSLSGMRAAITTNASGAQVLTWTIPADLVPTYIYSAADGSYAAATPVYLHYNIAPTAEKKDSGETLYTNNWGTAPTTVVFTLDGDSPLVTTGEIRDIPAVIKGENTTETNPNVNTTAFDSATNQVTVTLGNNGKWVNGLETTMNINVNTLWYDGEGAQLANPDETTTDTLYRYSTDGSGNIVGEPTAVEYKTFGSGTWNGTFSDLLVKDENGNAYIYRITQTITSASGAVYKTTYQVNSGAEASTCGNVTRNNSTVTIYNRQPSASDLTVYKSWVDVDGNRLTNTADLPEVTAQVMQVDTATAKAAPATHTVTFVFNHRYKEGSTIKDSYTPSSYSIEVSTGSTATLTINEATGLGATDDNPTLAVTSTAESKTTNTLSYVSDMTYNHLITLSGGITVTDVTEDVTVTVLFTGVWSTSTFSAFDVTTAEVTSRSTHTVSFLINGQCPDGTQECSGLSGATSTASFSVSGVEDGKNLTMTLTNASGLRMWCGDAQPTITVTSTGDATVTNTLAYTLDTSQSSSISPYLTMTGTITVENITEDMTVTVLLDEVYLITSKFTSFEYTTDITGGGTGGGTGGRTGRETGGETTVTETVYTTVTLNAANGWLVSLSDLPTALSDEAYDHTYTYYVVETNGADYGVTYTNNGGVTAGLITMTNTAPVKTVPDTVVVDYGLPVDIHVLANDTFGTKGTLIGIGAVPTSTEATDALQSGFGSSYTTGLFGTAEIKDDAVVYTPADMQMSDKEVFAYAVKYTNGDTVRYYYDTVTVVPATTIYYEDSFIVLDGSWETTGESQSAHQSEDRPGGFEFPDYDADNVYGYDGAYDTCTTYSLGSAVKTTVSGSTYAQNGSWPTARFTFSGTGFDLISLTSNQTGFITCRVYEGTTTDTLYKSWVVDTYYGYERTIDTENPWVKYTWTYNGERWSAVKECVAEKGDDETAELPTNPQAGDVYVQYKENYVWTPATGADNSLYQIPVIKSPDLPYGIYTVVVTPTYIPFFDHTGAGSYDFYLDAVRVYNPAQNMDDYYVLDGEGWPQYIELRKQLLGKDASGNAESYVSGISFIDGVSGGSVSDYENYGPNNEIYLNSRQAVAFAIESNGASIASVQVGIKTFGQTGTLTASCVDAESNILATSDLQIGTHTGMYYSLTNLNGVSCLQWQDSGTVSQAIVLTNTGSMPITLTTLKITYKSQPGTKAELCMDLALMQAASESVTQKLASLHSRCYHRFAYAVDTVPTETEVGVLTGTCADCGETVTLAMPVLADSRYTSTVTKEPTCTEAGIRAYTDAEYNVSFDVELPALGHALVTDTAVAATCSQSGLTEGCHCTRCDYRVEQTVTEATGHSYADGLCVLCGEKQQEEGELPAVCPSEIFTDAPAEANWAHEGIDFVVGQGLMDGVGNGLFAPNGAMDRAMLVTVLWRLEGKPEASSEADFADVPSDTWYTAAVAWAREAEIVYGVGGNCFDPTGEVTREQTAVILCRYACSKQMAAQSGDLSRFADRSEVSAWAEEAVSWAEAAGILRGADENGRLLLQPKKAITRAEAAAMLTRYCKAMEEAE